MRDPPRGTPSADVLGTCARCMIDPLPEHGKGHGIPMKHSCLGTAAFAASSGPGKCTTHRPCVGYGSESNGSATMKPIKWLV